ncbi:MAG TPA: nicotinamide-nucleotide amidohydrolase family protein [Nocardioidaceae bacterium]|nr:nicotinamide-nucleotide amidohydrolase family protein [Nocardioidaceae bacterium]
MDESAEQLQEALAERGVTVASAESLTGGAVAELLSEVPGSSGTFRGGVVAYTSEVKMRLLGVSEHTVSAAGVVSAQCAREMASGAAELFDAAYAVSTTGVAGPERQEGKPVGLVYVAVHGPAGVEAFEHRLSGDRARIRAETCRLALRHLLAAVGG